jgi:hypothetical protein
MARLAGALFLAGLLVAAAAPRLFSAVPAPAVPAAPAAAGGSLELEIKPDIPTGYPGRVGRFATPLRQDLTLLRLTRLGGGRYALSFARGGEAPALAEVDLRPFIPRVPRLAQGEPPLVRLALIQRELNRIQTRYAVPGTPDSVFLANNCLRRGLWEIGLDRRDTAGQMTYFHGWFTFPEGEYARLFEEVNGAPFSAFAADLTGYPMLDGIPVPLAALRSPAAEARIQPVAVHADEPVERFSEQARKAKLVLSSAARVYGDWAARDRQPVVTAKFNEPGFYDSSDPVRFDVAWLSSPVEAWWRRVKSAKLAEPFTEVEIRFANGYRLLLADGRLVGLAARSEKPADDGDALRLTFGIGTPDIYASAEDRARELAAEVPSYLLLLDAKGANVDNHHAGLDRVYLWRENGAPGRLHLYLVSYERILLAAHYSLPWQG